MDSIVEENGNSSSNMDDSHNHQQQQQQHQQQQQQQQQNASTNTNAGNLTQHNATPAGSNLTVLTTTANVQYGLQPQSVIQANQSSVIQTATANAQPMSMTKGGVLFVSKPSNTTVIHTTPGNAVHYPPMFSHQIKPEPNTQPLDSNSEDSLSDEDSPRHRRELTRRPSYHKIFNEISGPDIADNSVIAEDQTRKREIRLQKNREAARECRRKKKEYIKCLENRVAVLENQNKALIEELKSLKELYCSTKTE